MPELVAQLPAERLVEINHVPLFSGGEVPHDAAARYQGRSQQARKESVAKKKGGMKQYLSKSSTLRRIVSVSGNRTSMEVDMRGRGAGDHAHRA